MWPGRNRLTVNASRRLCRSGTTSIAPQVIVAGRAVERQQQPRSEQRHQRIAIARRRRWIEQRVGVGDAEIVRGVEIVNDERARSGRCCRDADRDS